MSDEDASGDEFLGELKEYAAKLNRAALHIVLLGQGHEAPSAQ